MCDKKNEDKKSINDVLPLLPKVNKIIIDKEKGIITLHIEPEKKNEDKK